MPLLRRIRLVGVEPPAARFLLLPLLGLLLLLGPGRAALFLHAPRRRGGLRRLLPLSPRPRPPRLLRLRRELFRLRFLHEAGDGLKRLRRRLVLGIGSSRVIFSSFAHLRPLLHRHHELRRQERREDEPQHGLLREECLGEVLADVKLAREDSGVVEDQGGGATPSQPAHVVRNVFGIEDEEDVHEHEHGAERCLQPEEDVGLEVLAARRACSYLRREDVVAEAKRAVGVLGEVFDHEEAEPEKRAHRYDGVLERPDGVGVVVEEVGRGFVLAEHVHQAHVAVRLAVAFVIGVKRVGPAPRRHPRLRCCLDEVVHAAAEEVPPRALVLHVIVDLGDDGVGALSVVELFVAVAVVVVVAAGHRVVELLTRARLHRHVFHIRHEGRLVHAPGLVQRRRRRRQRQEELHRGE